MDGSSNPATYSGDERREQSIGQYFDELQRCPDLVRLSQLWKPLFEETTGDEESGARKSFEFFAKKDEFCDKARAAFRAMLEKSPEAYAKEAVMLLGSGSGLSLVEVSLGEALFEAGYEKENGWQSSNPIFQALAAALETENDVTRRWPIVRVLILQYDGRMQPFRLPRCDEQAVRRLQVAARREASADADMLLLAIIGYNAYRWPDVQEWFDRNAPAYAKGFAYLPIVESVLGNIEQKRIGEVLDRVKEIDDDVLYSATCFSLVNVVSYLRSLLDSGEEIAREAKGTLDSVIRPFVLERANAARFEDQAERREGGSQIVPGIIHDTSCAARKPKEHRDLTPPICNVLAAIGDSECIAILEETAINPDYKLRPTRTGAMQALLQLSGSNPDAGIESCLRILEKGKNLPDCIGSEALKNIVWMWVYGGPEQRFFERDKNFQPRLDTFRKLIRQEVGRWNPDDNWGRLAEAMGLMGFFDRDTALELLDQALTQAKEDAAKKGLLKVKQQVLELPR